MTLKSNRFLAITANPCGGGRKELIHRLLPDEDDPKSISNEITFHEDIDDPDHLLDILRNLSDKVGSRLRKADFAGWVVQIKIRYSDFTTLTRQTSLKECSNLDQDIFDAARELLLNNLIHYRPVRLLGVGVTKTRKTPSTALTLG